METKPQTKFRELLEAYQRLQGVLDISCDALDGLTLKSNYRLCVHVPVGHGLGKFPLKMSGWIKGSSVYTRATFTFGNDGTIAEIEAGEYTKAEVADMRAIIDRWLAL